jgi:P27 family predicted phage terminase small subunit
MRRLTGEYPKSKPATALAGKPKKPEYLSTIASAKWDEMVSLLRKRGTLTKADGSALEIFCEGWARWRALLLELANEGEMVEHTVLTGNGTPITKRIVNPAAKLASQLETSLRNSLREFSATPVTRDRTKPAKEKPAPKASTKPFKAEESLSPDALALLNRKKEAKQ